MAFSDDWSYQLGQSFVAAAQLCGFACDRVFVADGCAPEGMAPGCPCQLAVVVTEGWAPLPKCGARRVAEVRLVLDLCTTAWGPDEVPDPVALNTKAQANAAARWAIMSGLRKAWAAGDLSSCGEELGPLAASLCGRIIPGPWRCVRSTNGWARWEALWRFEDDL